jgi:hypothetical protein
VGSYGRLQGDRIAEATGGSQDPCEIGRCGGTRHRHPEVCEHLQGAGLSETFPHGQDFAPAPYGLPRHRVRRCQGGQPTDVAPLEEVQKGTQSRDYVLQHRHTGGAKARCGAILDRARDAADHRERLLCRGRDPLRGPGVASLGAVAVQVHHVGERPRVGIIGQIPGAVQKDVVRVVVRTPGIQGVDGW